MTMRKPNEVVQLKLRFAERLRARLEKAASKTNDSLNTEIVRRLERSFAEEDVIAEALGGHELRHLALSFASTFADGGKSAARAAGHDDWTARDWIQDQDCYRIGIVRAMMNLIEAMPNPSPQEKELLLVYLKTRMTNSLIQSGHLKVDFHDGRGPVGNEFLGPTDEERKAAEDAAPATVSDPHPVTEEEYDRLVVEMEENSRRTAEEASKRAHTADAATEAAVKKVAKAIRGRQAGAGKRQKGAA